MGDEWPYAPAQYLDWNSVYNYLLSLGLDDQNAATLTAIGTAESSLDVSVVNNTPATGDLSVGIWQINYFGNLYAGRAAAYGTPQQLVLGGLATQARAAISVASGGYGPWSTYKSGAYLKYLHGFAGVQPSQTGPGGTGNAPPTNINADSWDAAIHQSAASLWSMAVVCSQYEFGIDAI
jgi:hypothetical protein